MKVFFLFLVLLTFFTCNKKDHAGTVGSGAGIEKEEGSKEEDLNITTPIDEEREQTQ